MRRWHRPIALFLALIFAPSTLLGAMPLVWCVGSDGHRAVEYASHDRDGGRHANHRVLGQQFVHDDVLKVEAEDDNCRDLQILDTSAKSEPQSRDGVLPFDIRVFVALPTLPLVERAVVALSTDLFCTDYRCLEPPNIALRSVVLRI